MGARVSIRLLLLAAAALCLSQQVAFCQSPTSPEPAPATQATQAKDARTIVTDENFDFQKLVLDAKKPVVIECFAPWCGPCRMMNYVTKDFAGDNEGKVAVFRVDIDKCASLAKKYDVDTLPTVLVFNKGTLADRFEGFHGRSRLDKAIEKTTADRR